MRKILLLMMFLPAIVQAEFVKTKFNPWTSQLDFITKVDSHTIVAGSNITVISSTFGTVTISGSGSGGSGGYALEPATVTIQANKGVSGTTITLTAFNSTSTSMTVTGGGGFGVTYGAIFGSATVSNLAAGQCVQTGAAGLLTVTGSACGSAAGGGASTLAIYTGTPTLAQTQVSSPTAIINLDRSTLAGTFVSGATAYISVQAGVSSPTGSFTIGSTSTIILANCAAACTQTLPTAIGVGGKIFAIKMQNAAPTQVTIATTGGQTIDGATTQILYLQNTNLEIISDNANWQIF